ncbi:gamma-glutamyltransferase [Sphingomonas sp.]|uniref:gamma-glutamyltransferase n=1 Tax=Sphingomonas sp. TaxID=28214 RepID=UPI00286E456B|nr:gamma-glutamyltransferase [Sphingomonas sp.]
MRLRFVPLLAAVLLAACARTPSLAQPAPLPPPTLETGMVSAADPRAAAAGIEILRQGGSATDAALATLLALTVVEPQSSGIGGGGFLVHGDPRGAVTSYDGRETAPMAATGTWFFKDGQPLSFDEAIPGGKSVGVPGNVRLMALAHRDLGRVHWRTLFAPAIKLARDGFAITPRLHRALGRYRETGALSLEARGLFYGANGNPLPVGTIVRNRALAALFERLATTGPDAFYVGPNAQAIVAAVNAAPRNPSAMTAGDLAAYDAKPRPAVCGTYRAHRICGMGPPSSGATTVLAILKQLERFDLAALGPASPAAWHLFAESTRLAFADRDRFLADPDFQPVPVAGLIDPGYLAARSALIAPDRAIANIAPGNPVGAPRVTAGLTPAENGTSHFVAADRFGNIASLTSTIESAFGSGLMVNGYYLNNELTDLSLVPERDGRPVANRVEPGKRPRSSMAPTIVYGPDGRPRLAVGAAGGATIIVQVAKAIIGVIDWRLSAQQAIALPVVYAPGDTLFVERGTSLEAMIPALRALGHPIVEPREPSFKANAIEFVAGRRIGAADPRSEGVALGD